MPVKYYLFYILVVLTTHTGFSQAETQDTIYSLSFENEKIVDVLEKLRSLTGRSILYSQDFIDPVKRYTGRFSENNLDVVLHEIAKFAGLSVVRTGDSFVLRRIRKFHVSGLVRDRGSHERLPYATIYFPSLHKYIGSDESGRFQVVLEEGKHFIEASYLGHEDQRKEVFVDQDLHFVMELSGDNVLPEIVIWEYPLSI